MSEHEQPDAANTPPDEESVFSRLMNTPVAGPRIEAKPNTRVVILLRAPEGMGTTEALRWIAQHSGISLEDIIKVQEYDTRHDHPVLDFL